MYDILKNGAILIGKNFTVDGHYKRLFRAVTHFHSDHLTELEKSLKECTSIIGTPATIEALDVLGYIVPKHKKFPLEYGIEIELSGERIKLEKAEHILGAAQVLIETDETEIAYTGDFREPGKGTKILNPDILIIDATYGNPRLVRQFKQDVDMLFADYVSDELLKRPVKIYGYYGKIQEAMKILRKYGVEAPFLVDNKIEKLTRIFTKYEGDLKNVVSLNTPEGREVLKNNWYVAFEHATQFKKRDKFHANFLLDGWLIDNIIKTLDQNSFVIGMSSHADFEETVYYIDNTSADLIVVDGSRSQYAKDLASYINTHMKKKAVVLPR
ncbi:MBL fold metallo-hydrolase [Sulfolobus acidocaldarius]|uniref:Conserved Archaeal protein n=4 Tax=Sulfolobus acidocaldarius TaxID=2285 RepID=Q4JAM2_SULAC|nr:MBL fold metallo-hydrolase [Sulfolobus acidocaldarius]AAY80157.1 conserved Archaeal protein [Sulfolobus acidocaldarius DSM 639]AGE70735.1 hypothetical protein SacN8_03815 [Sulfolobus acidocaldarius N8]AGE73007.1 hypothetical protein SacRon12I_03800 [Sulfolobus acidocaldarius Ron12/I]ALU28931.1 exonuclease [Sulfolobus acidocaldarius]ALU31657.1 exonuclease [Sulfolobus acidocaldarius]